jgi:hypothetical protein
MCAVHHLAHAPDRSPRMSVLGHKQTVSAGRRIVRYGPKADLSDARRLVSFGPKAVITPPQVALSAFGVLFHFQMKMTELFALDGSEYSICSVMFGQAVMGYMNGKSAPQVPKHSNTFDGLASRP